MGAALRKVKDELQASTDTLRIKDEENLQARAEVRMLQRREKELTTDVDRQRSELRRVQAELDMSLGQNGRLGKEISGVKSNLQVALKVQQSNESQNHPRSTTGSALITIFQPLWPPRQKLSTT
jgi:chromosome segregation ATPase